MLFHTNVSDVLMLNLSMLYVASGLSNPLVGHLLAKAWFSQSRWLRVAFVVRFRVVAVPLLFRFRLVVVGFSLARAVEFVIAPCILDFHQDSLQIPKARLNRIQGNLVKSLCYCSANLALCRHGGFPFQFCLHTLPNAQLKRVEIRRLVWLSNNRDGRMLVLLFLLPHRIIVVYQRRHLVKLQADSATMILRPFVNCI